MLVFLVFVFAIIICILYMVIFSKVNMNIYITILFLLLVIFICSLVFSYKYKNTCRIFWTYLFLCIPSIVFIAEITYLYNITPCKSDLSRAMFILFFIPELCVHIIIWL